MSSPHGTGHCCGRWYLYQQYPLSYFAFYCFEKHHDQKGLFGSQTLVTVHRERKSGQELLEPCRQELKQKPAAHRLSSLSSLSPLSCRLQGHLPNDVTTRSGLDPLISIINQGNDAQIRQHRYPGAGVTEFETFSVGARSQTLVFCRNSMCY